MNPSKRKEDEKFEDYRARLKRGHANEKAAQKGVNVWDSGVEPKTYIKAKHGPL